MKFWLIRRRVNCEQSLRMVTRARKSSKSKKQEAEGKELGEGGEEAPLSSFPLGAISPSQVLPSLDSTDWRGTAENIYHTYLHILQNSGCIRKPQVISKGGGGVGVRSPCTLSLDPLLYKNCATADISMLP